MKDAARLLGYFGATIIFGAMVAPPLFWAAQSLAAHGVFPSLPAYGFESFFHRALLIGAVLFLWPFLRWLCIKGPRDLGLTRNPSWARDLGIGFLISILPAVCYGAFLVASGHYTMRTNVAWGAVMTVALTAAVVPLLEEALFRGLFLGVLLRNNGPLAASVLISAIFSIVHFLKAPDDTSTSVTWTSGFVSIAHSFDQFTQPLLVLAGFTTLFFIGLILAYARIKTRSLWLPIGLHAGWILASGAFNKIAHRETIALPWVGKNLLIGIVPLVVCLVSWVLVSLFLRYAGPRES